MTKKTKIKTKLHFARFEFKYILPRDLRQEVERELKYFVALDPYVSPKKEACYFVRSLYFDDPVFTAFHEKIDGVHTRHKFRLRTYSSEHGDETPIFMEVKGRFNNLVFKHRAPVDKIGSRDVFGDDVSVEQMVRWIEPGRVRDWFEFEVYRRQLRPNVLIDYHRRPCVSKYDPEFRLTFDDRLNCTATSRLYPHGDERQRQGLSGYSIMEVKFRYHMPSWFHRIVQSYELQRVSISKYCRGLGVLEIADDLS